MRKYDHILLDVDGTLTDSAPGIINSLNHALEKLNMPAMPEAELMKCIGPPLSWSFHNVLGFPEERYQEVFDAYLEYYDPRGVFESRLYPGIPELLERLKKAGYRLYVASSKKEEYVLRVIEHFGIAGYFDFICGSDIPAGRPDKPGVVRHIMETMDIRCPDRALMVGDRFHDVVGAAKFGIGTCGALWGYGTREELESSGAVFTAKTPEELAEILNS